MIDDQKIYVSITGLQIRNPIYSPVFWWHAVRSMMQAKKAPGNLSADAQTINGVHHTLSVWKSREDMRAFLVSGAHGKAMKIFNKIATGKTFGFETTSVPGWEEVHRLWREKGVVYDRRVS